MKNAWRWSTQLNSNINLRQKDKLLRERVESPFLVIIKKKLYLHLVRRFKRNLGERDMLSSQGPSSHLS